MNVPIGDDLHVGVKKSKSYFNIGKSGHFLRLKASILISVSPASENKQVMTSHNKKTSRFRFFLKSTLNFPEFNRDF